MFKKKCNNELLYTAINSPSPDNRPYSRKKCWRINDQTNAKPFRIMSAQQPDQIFDQLIVHTIHTEFGQIEHYTQIVDDFFEASFACLFQAIHNEFRQFIDITGGSVMVFRWNVNDWPTETISVLEDACLVGIV